MIDEGRTWVVAADGVHAKVFEERSRSGSLRELADRAMRIEGADRPVSKAHPGTVHERAGVGRHAGEGRRPSQEAETRFLHRLVQQIDAAAARGEFDRLVLIAPPTALGVLRAALTPRLAERLSASDPHNRTGDDADAMRAHLRRIRAIA